MAKREFVIDFKVTKQKALDEWALVLIEEVLQDKDKKRGVGEKFEVIQQIVSDAVKCKEDFGGGIF